MKIRVQRFFYGIGHDIVVARQLFVFDDYTEALFHIGVALCDGGVDNVAVVFFNGNFIAHEVAVAADEHDRLSLV